MTLFASLKLTFLLLLPALVLAASTLAQNTDQAPRVALQPLAQQVRQMEEALSFLGQPLPAAAGDAIMAKAQKATALRFTARSFAKLLTPPPRPREASADQRLPFAVNHSGE